MTFLATLPLGSTRPDSPGRTPRSLPPVATTVAVGAAVVTSLVPSLLPRSAMIQGVLSGALVLLAIAALALARIAALALRAPAPPSPRARQGAFVATVVLSAAALVPAQHALARRSAELSMPTPSAAYWLLAAGCVLAVVGIVLALVAGLTHLLRSTWQPARRGIAAALLVSTVTTAASPAGLLDPLRKDLAPDHPMLVTSPVGATRAFARADEAADPETGAALAADRLLAAGGLRHAAVVVVLPTGSGWVNREAVAAIETQLGGDVALVSAQFADLPSWYQYLVDQDAAHRSGQRLLAEVLDRVRTLPESERPDVYVYGESLGARVGQGAVQQAPHDEVCGVLWSGAPGGTVSGHPRERSLLNQDDPIGYLDPGTAYRRPEGWPTVWVPLLSYGTTWLDTNASLRPPPGHGHQYGAEQDWTLPRC